ncbi:MAG: tRNA pseudouridine(55) synthase TruB [Oscillospiraceae bacterium]|jgi:tRNA pseudouridine55 synthase|nr:tRNA pseudouridine(55) synthase TruB [Oscillospiraceae bacterium]
MKSSLLLLDKPEGITSFSAVSRARRILGIKKAGHTGTLDPMATGVLPVLLGGATRFAEFLPGHDKAYLAGLRLGLRTDTLDITGGVLEERSANVTRGELEAALAGFRGKIMQTPPMYSAKSQGGKRLYELARQGIEVEREARAVEIYRLELLDGTSICVECSAGTYIRSLIDGLGNALGCGACMASLRRTKANGYGLERCVTLGQLERGDRSGLIPLDEALSAYPAVHVSPAQAVRFRNGGALDLARLQMQNPAEGALHRVYGEDVFMGLGKIKEDELAVARLLIP